MQLDKTNAAQCKFPSTHLEITHIGRGGNIYTIENSLWKIRNLKITANKLSNVRSYL